MAAMIGPVEAAAPATFLALGDSYTIGEGVAADRNWPSLLADALRAQKVDIADPQIVARTGWTTDELSDAMDRHAFHPPYDLVTLLIGVNDQYRGRDVAAYEPAFDRLLVRAITLAGGRAQRVIVVSIPDWGVTPFAQSGGRDRTRIAHEIDAYNAVNARIAAARRVHYVDVTQDYRERGDLPQMLVADGLHPSPAMYDRWVEFIASTARRALSSR
ncbi:MAG TPA: SGNH/GDSL hydrolase family protein [Rudaea sp.]